MKIRSLMLVVLASLIVNGALAGYLIPSADAIGVANVVVTRVYWGSNPMEPSAVHPGDLNVQLSIVLSNVGDDVARGVNATLFFGPPLTYTYYTVGVQYTASAVSKIAGDISAGGSFTLGYTVNVDSNAKEGVHRYRLLVAYRSARELQQVNSDIMVDVPLWKGELHVQSVVTVPTKIYPNSKQVLVKVAIVNSGQGAAKDLQLGLALMYPFKASSSNSDRIYIGNIPVGQVTVADFVLDIDRTAPFGQYPLTLGEEVGERMIPIGQVPLYINEKVKFDIIEIEPKIVHAGDSGQVIRVELKNAGSVKADSVRVQLRVGNFFTGTLTDFLGTMIAGEVKVAFFTVDIDSKAQPRQYNLDLRVDWTQEDNALDDTLAVFLIVEPQGPPFTLITVGVVFLIIIGGYFFIRRRRMKAQTSK